MNKLIVPTLRVGMPFWTLCVQRWGMTQSVMGGVPTQSLGTINSRLAYLASKIT